MYDTHDKIVETFISHSTVWIKKKFVSTKHVRTHEVKRKFFYLAYMMIISVQQAEKKIYKKQIFFFVLWLHSCK